MEYFYRVLVSCSAQGKIGSRAEMHSGSIELANRPFIGESIYVMGRLVTIMDILHKAKARIVG